jgi:hypothetical protein
MDEPRAWSSLSSSSCHGNGPSHDLLSSFDEYHQIALQTLTNYEKLKQNNFVLSADNQNLTQENQEFRKILLEKDVELELMTKKLSQTFHLLSAKYNSMNLEIDHQKSLMNMQYDLDILVTNNRQLEKDLMLQKTENERLRNSNSQLARELQKIQGTKRDTQIDIE